MKPFLKNTDFFCLSMLFLFALARVLSIQPVGCLDGFDCHSYLSMMTDLSPAADIPGHHAVRIFPILLARGLMGLGLSLDHSFQCISGASYITFGMLSYWVISRMTQNKTQALAWALILLSFHHALRGSLDVIYQACDALVYPIGLGILYATYRSTAAMVVHDISSGLPRAHSALAMTENQEKVGVFASVVMQSFLTQRKFTFLDSVFASVAKQSRFFMQRNNANLAIVFFLSVIGTLTRQNLFLLGFLSLVYLAKEDKNHKAVFLAALLAGLYITMGRIYGDTQLVDQLRSLPPSVFTLQGQWDNLIDAHIQDLFIVISPLLIFHAKALITFLRQQWHWALFIFITMGQPFVGYHMTGSANYQRLASQGVWVLILALALSAPRKVFFKNYDIAFVGYAIAVYITWGISQRWVMALAFLSLTVFLSLKTKQRQPAIL